MNATQVPVVRFVEKLNLYVWREFDNVIVQKSYVLQNSFFHINIRNRIQFA